MFLSAALLLLVAAFPALNRTRHHHQILRLREVRNALLNGLQTTGAVGDGVVRLSAPCWDHTLSFWRGKGLHPPYQLKAELLTAAGTPEAFHLSLGRQRGRRLRLSLNETRPEECGVFSESTERTRRLVDLSGLASRVFNGEPLSISIETSRKELRITLPERVVRLPVKGDELQGEVVLETQVPARELRVTRFELSQPELGGATEVLTGGTFHRTPLFFNTRLALGAGDTSLLFQALGLLVLWGLALLLNRGLLTLVPYGAWLRLTREGASLLLLPLVGVLLFALRASLALDGFSLALCLAALALERTAGVARAGFGASAGLSGRRFGPANIAQALSGAAILAVLLVVLGPQAVRGSPLSSTLVGIAFFAPLGLLALGARLGRHNPAAVLLAVAVQLCAFPLVRASYPLGDGVALYAACLAVWTVGTLADTARHGAALGRGRFPAVLALVLLALLSLEVGARQVIDHKGLKREIFNNDLNIEGYTNLLRNHDGKQQITVRERQVPIRKPPGVFRVLCLGSSSTDGLGSSDPQELSYPAQLQQQIDRLMARRAGPRVEVVNGAISAATLFTLSVFFREVLVRLSPDLVILYFGANGESWDAYRYYERVRAEVKAAPFIRTGDELWAALQLRHNPEWVLRPFLTLTGSRLFSLLIFSATQLKSRLVGSTMEQLYLNRFDPTRSPEAIIRACRRRGIKLLLIPEVCTSGLPGGGQRGAADTAPRFSQNCRSYRRLFADLARKYEGRGVHYADLYPAFARGNNASFLFDEMHMRDAGYGFLAQQILEILLAQGLLP